MFLLSYILPPKKKSKLNFSNHRLIINKFEQFQGGNSWLKYSWLERRSSVSHCQQMGQVIGYLYRWLRVGYFASSRVGNWLPLKGCAVQHFSWTHHRWEEWEIQIHRVPNPTVLVYICTFVRFCTFILCTYCIGNNQDGTEIPNYKKKENKNAN